MMNLKLDNFNVEISTVCNLKCEFCINSTMKKRHGFMESDVFEKTLFKLQELNPYPRIINLTGCGEPTLNPNVWDCYKRVKFLFPSAKLQMSTNGLTLDEKAIKHICDDNVITDLVVSLRFTNKERYLKYSGVDAYERVVQNIKNLLDYKGKKPKVYLQAFTTDNVLKFRLQWLFKLGYKDCVHKNVFVDLVGWINGKSTCKRKYQCKQIGDVIMVDIDGKFYPCCEGCWVNDPRLVLGTYDTPIDVMKEKIVMMMGRMNFGNFTGMELCESCPT